MFAHGACAFTMHTNSPRYHAWNGTSPNTAKIAIITDVRRRQIVDTKAKLQFLLQLRSKPWFVSVQLCACEHRIHTLRVLIPRCGIQSVILEVIYRISIFTDNNNYFRFYDQKYNLQIHICTSLSRFLSIDVNLIWTYCHWIINEICFANYNYSIH